MDVYLVGAERRRMTICNGKADQNRASYGQSEAQKAYITQISPSTAKDNFQMGLSFSCDRNSFKRLKDVFPAFFQNDRSTPKSQTAITNGEGAKTIDRAQCGAQQRCVPSRSVRDYQQATRMSEVDQSAVAI